MRLTHLGHACLLLEDSGARVLIDPGTFSPGVEELSDIDVVLATHAHPDHLDIERLPVLLEANPRARLVTEPETAAELVRVGLEATALHHGETVTEAGFEIRAVGDLHALIHADVPQIGNVGLVVRGPSGTTVFHPGDALDATPPAADRPDAWGPVDVLALPIGGPWLRIADAIDFARGVSPGAVLPIHDAPLSDIGRLLARRWLTELLADAVPGGILHGGSDPLEL
jgi:L-ascorbate metabolism protein UlaG (beta-lactamase superfamily)